MNGNGPPDTELVRRATGGDREAFAALYRRHAPALLRFCQRQLRDARAAAAVVRDCEALALRRLPELADPTRVRAWLYAVVAHRTHDLLARRSADPAPAEDDAAALDRLDAVLTVTGDLAPEDRLLIRLHLRGLHGRDLVPAGDGGSAAAPPAAGTTLEEAADPAPAGGSGCPALADLLDRWDSTPSTRRRRRLLRHVTGCPGCAGLRARPPVELVGAVALMGVSAPVRRRLLDELESAGDTQVVPTEPAAVPDPAPAPRRWRRAAVRVAAPVLVLLVFGGLVGAAATRFDDAGPSGASASSSDPGPGAPPDPADASPQVVPVPGGVTIGGARPRIRPSASRRPTTPPTSPGTGPCPSPAARVTITTGSVVLTPAPTSVQLDRFVSDTAIRLFVERVGLRTTQDLPVDVSRPGRYRRDSELTRAAVPVGTCVRSYYLQFDRFGASSLGRTLTGSVTFDTPVLGLATTSATHDATDSLGAPTTTYPDGAGRGLELDPQRLLTDADEVTLSTDLRRVDVRFTASSAADTVRVITAGS